MISKILMNLETNLIEDILTSLEPDVRKKAVKRLKALLNEKGVPFHSRSNIPLLVEDSLTIKEFRTIFRDLSSIVQFDSTETQKLKSYYLSQRIKRLTSSSENLRRSIVRELRKSLLDKGIISGDQSDSWTGLKPGERLEKVVYYAANFLNYLEIEEVFTRVLSKQSLSIVVREARNVDYIKNMTNSEILPFLQKLIIHQKSIEIEDIREALATIIEVFISDHHYYKLAANKYFTLEDIYGILERRVCLPDRQGKIGQKAAGMILASSLLKAEKSEFSDNIHIPVSYYLTSDVFFECLSSHTYNFSAFKHRLREGTISEPDLFEEYPKIRKLILSTVMPDIIRIELRRVLTEIGHNPVIVRSSSLLEDSVSAFSGKYDSYFLANQQVSDDPEEDIERRVDKLIENILKVYASALRPEALIYRRERKMLDIDERMCVLIQVVEGRQYGKYYFPALAGVGLSYNHRMNTEKIKWNDPVLRFGLGLGTGIVDIRGNQVKVVYPKNPDYSNIIDYYDIIKTSQQKFDVLNLESDEVQTITKRELFAYINEQSSNVEAFREFLWILGGYFLSTAEHDYIKDGVGLLTNLDPVKHVFTMNGLRQTKFYRMNDWALRILAKKYQPCDMEFTIDFPTPGEGKSEASGDLSDFKFTVVQCRQLTGNLEHIHHDIPEGLPEANVVCKAHKSVTSGYAPNIDTVVYVEPEKYYDLSESRMYTIARYIGYLNYALRKRRFILIGPGRWGSSTPQYGIKVTYSEIYQTLALVEIARKLGDDRYAETSLGSHFGNDLRESEIVTFSIYPGYENTIFRENIFKEAQNKITDYLKEVEIDDWINDIISVIDVETLPVEQLKRGDYKMHIIANSEKETGIMFMDRPRKMVENDLPVNGEPNIYSL